MKKVVAVKYVEELPAPFIIAKGKGEIAERIKKIASDNDITVWTDEELAESLIEIDVASFIPEKMYKIMAEIIIFAKDLRIRNEED